MDRPGDLEGVAIEMQNDMGIGALLHFGFYFLASMLIPLLNAESDPAWLRMTSS